MGVPQTKETFELPLIDSDEKQTGIRSIYISDLFILVTYYNNESLIGYIVISLDKHFNPEYYWTHDKLLKKSFRTLNIGDYGYPLMIGQSLSSRKDCAQTYYEIYTHHLATNSELVGYGISSIGYQSIKQEKIFGDKHLTVDIKLEDSDKSDFTSAEAISLEEHRLLDSENWMKWKNSQYIDKILNQPSFNTVRGLIPNTLMVFDDSNTIDMSEL